MTPVVTDRAWARANRCGHLPPKELHADFYARPDDKVLPHVHHWDISEQLRDKSIHVRDRATCTLARLAAVGVIDPIVPRLKLEDGDADVRCRATEVLGLASQAASPSHCQAIGRRLGDESPSVRHAAALSLARLGVPNLSGAPMSGAGLTELVARLQNEDAVVRLHAVEGFSLLASSAAPCAAQLADRLEDVDDRVWVSAASCLERLGKNGANALADLVRDRADMQVRRRAENSLERMGDVGATAVARNARSIDASTRCRAFHALSRMGRPGSAALAQLLEDPVAHMRIHALQALSEAGVSAHVHAEAVVERVRDENENVRDAAYATLSAFGPAGAEALASAGLGHQGADVRRRAAKALGRLDDIDVRLASGVPQPVQVCDALCLHAGFPAAPNSDQTALGKTKHPAEPHAVALAHRMGDDDAGAWNGAAEALGRLGSTGAQALADKLHGSSGPLARMRAEEALRWMGAPGAAAIASKLEDGSPAVRAHAARALGRMASAAEAHVGALRTRVEEDADPHVRRASAEALARTGAMGATALESCLGHRYADVRDCATEAIDRFRLAGATPRATAAVQQWHGGDHAKAVYAARQATAAQRLADISTHVMLSEDPMWRSQSSPVPNPHSWHDEARGASTVQRNGQSLGFG